MCKAICRSCTLRLNASHDSSIPASGMVLRAGVVTPVSSGQARYLLTLPLVDVLEALASPAPALEFATSDLSNASLPEESSL